MSRPPAATAILLFLAGRRWDEQAAASMVRSIRIVVAEESRPERSRLFPAVLQPPQITSFAFDVAGRLGPVTWVPRLEFSTLRRVGQRRGDTTVAIPSAMTAFDL